MATMYNKKSIVAEMVLSLSYYFPWRTQASFSAWFFLTTMFNLNMSWQKRNSPTVFIFLH